MYDLAIIGGGPGGAAAGVYASRKQLKTLFVTKDFLGQSSVSDGIENWIGTVKISGIELSKNLENHVRAYAGDTVTIRAGEICQKIEKKSDHFLITTNTTGSSAPLTYEAKTVLITTGSVRRRLDAINADRLEHKGVTYCASCDGPIFSGQDVAVIGGGNAAFESAAQLLAYCSSVRIIHRNDSFKADPVTVEKLSKHPKLTVITNAVVEEVHGDKFVSGLTYKNAQTGEKTTINLAGIFVEIGALPATYFAKDLVDMTTTGTIIVDPRTQRTSVHGIWAAGDCTDGLYHQNNIAAGDAVKALEDIYIHIKTQ